MCMGAGVRGLAGLWLWLQVTEVTAQTEYQLKLRDLTLNERVRELAEKAAEEARSAAER